MKNILQILKFKTSSSISIISIVMMSLLSACENAVVSDAPILLDEDENPGDLDQDPNELLYGTRALQIKTFEEIKKTYQALTGLNVNFIQATDPTTDLSLETYYTNNKASLPQTNKPESFGPAQVVAIQNYAAEFCVRTVNNASIRNSLYAGTGFTQAGQVPRDTLLGSQIQRQQLVDHIISKFWKPSSSASRIEARNAFLAMVENLYATSPTNDNANGGGIVAAACTAGLSAIAVIAQ